MPSVDPTVGLFFFDATISIIRQSKHLYDAPWDRHGKLYGVQQAAYEPRHEPIALDNTDRPTCQPDSNLASEMFG